MLSPYQKAQIMILPLMFAIIYSMYLLFVKNGVIIIDILWCSISIFIIKYVEMYFTNYYMVMKL